MAGAVAGARLRSTIVDLDGNAVPATGNFDIGAYQLTLFASGFEP